VFRYFVLAYCVWQASDLALWWRPNSPEAWGLLMFGVWLVPAVVFAISSPGPDRPRNRLLITAAVVSLIGQLTWLNVVQHVALVLAIAGWRQPFRGQLVWMAAGCLWMPACGWVLSAIPQVWAMLLRGIAVLVVASVVLVLETRQRQPSQSDESFSNGHKSREATRKSANNGFS
jgi:lysylphosphatidylglycerol synthetase-like protein (DUF2156 family)